MPKKKHLLQQEPSLLSPESQEDAVCVPDNHKFIATSKFSAASALRKEREQLLSILGSLHEPIYVADLNTYEILFVNRRFKQIFGDPVGKLCYEILQNIAKPCSFCTNNVIRNLKGFPYYWEQHDTSIDRDFLRIDRIIRWPDGRDVRLGFAIDVTKSKHVRRCIIEAREREQHRIGQDLHDGPLQQLVGISAMAEALTEHLENEGIEAAEIARKIRFLLSDAIDQTRKQIKGLYPIQIERNGLCSALDEMADSISEKSKCQCSFTCGLCPVEMDQDRAIHLYRIAQEAVNNALKHAKPKHITMSLKPHGSRYILTIEDDGIGIPEAYCFSHQQPLPPNLPAGMGLSIMQHRAIFMHAALTVERRKSNGTRLVCVFTAFPKQDLENDKNENKCFKETNVL